MTPENILVQDFDFSEYPVIRSYQMGEKTVIQIGSPTRGNSSPKTGI
jgi:hypothetical protein